MEKGAIVKFSEAGLDRLFPRHNGFREEAKKKRFKFRNINRKDSGIVRVSSMTGKSFTYYSKSFVVPA